jgi:non-specific serine/threonine protein kinase
MGKLIANRFTINNPEKDLLGRGGMGDVYRATDTQTGETVAVKALNPEILARDPTLLERFVREGEALRQLNHPNIVRMVAAVEEDGRHYLVMEYVGGGSLQDLLFANGQLPNERVIQIALDLADALTRAHRLGIIHRDLKPANVLLAEDGTPRLTDFGIAYIADTPHLTQTGILVGTVDYLCPEACNGEKLDERADIWSFGVMLFQMLAGCLPFTGESLTSKLTAILTHPIHDLTQYTPEVPDALADLVYRMLEKDPQQRIPSVRLVGAELEAMLKGREPVTPSRVIQEERRFETPTSALKAKHNLPIQPTAFVGRQAELTELARLLNDPAVHLVTILGAGGMGKTRLALEAGTAQLKNFKHRVYFVSLAPLESIEAIIPTTAQAIGFSFYEGGEPRQQLLDYLREKSMLLILDNFEHLLSGVDLVSEILNTAPQVKILSTSRTRLNVQGEQLFHLSGMDFPDWETPADAMEYSAVKLFLQSARRVRPDFELTPDNLKYVARICKLVEGMPLGILLAASWVEMLAPEEIAKEIEKDLDFLETEQRDLPDRQHSMRAVFDYSWNLLTPGEQEVFKKLSVFRGGFTREAAQQVTNATLRELMGLVNKSLLHRAPTGRYDMHELLRQYARDRLLDTHDDARVRDRHLDYFIKWSEGADKQLKGPNQREWLSRMEFELDNFRVSLEWSQKPECDPESGLRLVAAVLWFWWLHGHFEEAKQWIERTLARSTSRQTSAMAHVLSWAGIFLSGQPDQFEKAMSFLEDSLRIGRDLNDKASISWALMMMARVAEHKGDSVSAMAFGEEALKVSRELGETWYICFALERLGEAVRLKGDYDRAATLYEESLGIAQRIGVEREIATLLHNLGHVSLQQGDLVRATERFWKSLLIAKEIGEGRRIIMCLEGIAGAIVRAGELERAARLFAATAQLRHALGADFEAADHVAYLRDVAPLQRKRFEMAWEEGRAMTLEQAIELALSDEASR